MCLGKLFPKTLFNLYELFNVMLNNQERKPEMTWGVLGAMQDRQST